MVKNGKKFNLIRETRKKGMEAQGILIKMNSFRISPIEGEYLDNFRNGKVTCTCGASFQ